MVNSILGALCAPFGADISPLKVDILGRYPILPAPFRNGAAAAAALGA
jgi:hypothetical protein